MMNLFFFITSYDVISSELIASIINHHPDIDCDVSTNDSYLPIDTAAIDAIHHMTIDQWIITHRTEKKISGNIQQYSAFELQYKTLAEKTMSHYKKANLLVSPVLHIQLILEYWLKNEGDKKDIVDAIEKQCIHLDDIHHPLFSLSPFHYFYQHLLATVKDTVDLNPSENKLFLLALAKVITYDTEDIPTSGKHFFLEKLIEHEDNFVTFLNYLTENKTEITPSFKTDLSVALKNAREKIAACDHFIWQPWQKDLLDKYLYLR